MFIDAVEDDPDGNAMRQVPIEESNFASTLWISELGMMRRRFPNVFTNTWTWGPPIPPHVDANGIAFVHTACGKIKLTNAIAAAWIVNSHNHKKPRVRCVEDGLQVANMYWTEGESDVELDDESDDDTHEEWKTLSNGCRLSSKGRVVNKVGEVCNGTYFRGKKMICMSTDKPRQLDTLVASHFRQSAGSQTQEQTQEQRQDRIPARILRLIAALRIPKSVHEYAQETGLQESTVWSYMYHAFLALTTDECREIADRETSKAARRAMRTIFDEGREHIFSLPAKEYMPHIDSLLIDDAEWKCNPHRFHEIRILKLMCEKMAHRQ